MTVDKRKYKRFFFPKQNEIIIHLSLSNDDNKWNYVVARLQIIFHEYEKGEFTMNHTRMKYFIEREIDRYDIKLDKDLDIKLYLQDMEINLLYKLEEMKL